MTDIESETSLRDDLEAGLEPAAEVAPAKEEA